jgi:GT2 family glycosyltransferase
MSVSVVVRCVGREKLFRGVLERLTRQTIKPSEILVVMDCDSREEVDYVQKRLGSYSNAQLLFFKHAEFSHPYSANLGVVSSREELVCITNGHSFPTSKHWLEAGLRHFADGKVAGVSGFFLPSAKGIVAKLFYAVEGPLKRITWVSTINCIIRKARWKEYPFDEGLLALIPETRKYGGEDYDWSLEMRARGYKIVLDPRFSVIHAHEISMGSEVCRNLRNYFVYRKLQEKIKRLQRPRHAVFSGLTTDGQTRV